MKGASQVILKMRSKGKIGHALRSKSGKAVVLSATAVLILFGLSLFNAVWNNDQEISGAEQQETNGGPGPVSGSPEDKDAGQPEIDVLEDADYLFDADSGEIFLSGLEIGDRIVDLSWSWEFRNEAGYSGQAEEQHITWIVVARDHYADLEPHITLLSEELIGCYVFDNSTDRGGTMGSNHWGESGKANATRGLRPWLNSTGISSGEGFYHAFSDSFKNNIVTTSLPNREWRQGTAYITEDRVFIPSTTELGDTLHTWTYEIGTAFPYFEGVEFSKKFALLAGDTRWYWTRSPNRFDPYHVRRLSSRDFKINYANDGNVAVRPAVNLKSDTTVTGN